MSYLNRILWSLVVPAVIGSTALPVRSQASPKVEDLQDVDVDLGLRIPMRDGVTLGGSLYRPHGQTKARPVILNLSPYLADSWAQEAPYLASKGFAVACVSVRGRGDSGGKFEALVHDGADGADAVEWLAKQPFCDGHVGLIGASYEAFVEWATTRELPPHLSTIIPTAAPYPGVDFPGYVPIYMAFNVQWDALVAGHGLNSRLLGNEDFWRGKLRRVYQDHAPFERLDAEIGFISPLLRTILQHPHVDAFWDNLSPSPDEYKRIDFPILTVTGYYDGDQPGAMAYYRRHMQFGASKGKANHFLVIGPWDHRGTWSPQPEVGGLKVGSSSVIDTKGLWADWYRWTMAGGPKPSFLKNNIAVYVMGRNEWRYADSLETIPNGRLRLFLGSLGRADDVHHSGSLTEQSMHGAPGDAWTYDPLHTEHGLAMPTDDPAPLTSQWAALHLDGEGVIYHSEPFREPLEITGAPRLALWLTMNVPDTDLTVELDEVTQDGTSIQLSTGSIRARHRESLREEKLVPIGVPQQFEIRNMTFFSRQVAKGSRLRLIVANLDDPSWEHNMQGGGIVAKETAANARTAHIQLLHEPGHESVLELPIVK